MAGREEELRDTWSAWYPVRLGQPDAIEKAESDLMSVILTGSAANITAALGNLRTIIAASAKKDTAKQP